MTAITTRAGKGSTLTWNEVDANFTNLNTYKAETDSPTFTGTVSGITKAMVGLGNVDNTSDVNKPVSTAQQTAIDSAVSTGISTHVGLADPHTQYLTETAASASTGSSLVGFTQGVTGVVSRTVQSVLRETISVKDFGAVGDGTTDDTAAFNLAIAYANSKGGHDRAGILGTTIFIPTGRYKITAGLTTVTVSNVVFQGESRDSAVLLINTTAGVFHFGGGTVAGDIVVGGGINNFKIEYQVTPISTSYVVYADYAYSLQIHDLGLVQIGTLIKCGRTVTYSSGEIYIYGVNGTIANAGFSLIELLYGSGFFMSNCHIFVYGVSVPTYPATMTTVAGTYVINTANGLLWDTAQFNNCIFERFYRGLNAYAASTAIYETFRFTNVIFDYISQEAVYIDSGGGGVASNMKFDSNCWFCSWSGAAIKVQSASGVCDKLYFSGDIPVAGKEGINLYNTTAKEIIISDMNITGTNKYGASLGAVYIQGGTTGFHIYNVVANHTPGSPWATDRSPYGLTIGNDCDNFIVTGCNFTGPTANYSIGTNSATSTNRKIYNNLHADYATSTAATVPASSTLYQNKTPFIEEYSFYGGTATVYNKNGIQIGTTGPCTFTLQPSEYYYITYTVVPPGLKTIQR